VASWWAHIGNKEIIPKSNNTHHPQKKNLGLIQCYILLLLLLFILFFVMLVEMLVVHKYIEPDLAILK
jgi:hypothetical protein